LHLSKPVRTIERAFLLGTFMKTIIIAGGSGFLGKHIATALRQLGYGVVTVSRTGAPTGNGNTVPWDALTGVVDGAHAVVNLAGTNVGGKRWSQRVRHEILYSRINATEKIVNAIRSATKPPALINVSGTGFYGNTMTPCSEAMGAGKTFLAEVTRAWEEEAMKASTLTRVAILRLGAVLDANEGALPRLALPMRFGVGGPLGSGRQWFPWIHRIDAVQAFVWAIENNLASGPYNVVAPDAERMEDVASTLGRVLHRPSWLRVPSAVLRLLLGRQADVVLHGQLALPTRLIGAGFPFKFPNLEGALHNLYPSSRVG